MSSTVTDVKEYQWFAGGSGEMSPAASYSTISSPTQAISMRGCPTAVPKRREWL
jgi:hypothetical protein